MFDSQNTTFIKRLTILALPIALQMLLQSAMGMADVFMVSGLGQVAIAAVGLSAKLHFLLAVLMLGVATGGSVLIAQFFGAKNLEKCAQILAVTLFVGFLTTLPCMVFFAWKNTAWLSLINPDQDVVVAASLYLKITAPALLLTQFIVIYESALRSTGNTTTPLLFSAIAGLTNIALNYLLIFGKLGFPEMGIAGAALGTLLSRMFQLMLVLGWLYGKKHRFAISLSQLNQWITKKEVLNFVQFSFPLVINYFVWALGNSAYHVLTGFSGTNALAAMGILVPFETAFFALFVGLANASAVMIGHALGAGQIDKAWRLSRIFNKLGFSLALIFCSILLFSRPYLIGLFSNVNAETAELLNQILLVFCLLVWIKVLNLVRIIGVLRAGGDNNYVLWADTIAMWGIGIPIFVLAIFVFKLPFVFIFLAMYIEDIVKALPINNRMKERHWLKNLTTS